MPKAVKHGARRVSRLRYSLPPSPSLLKTLKTLIMAQQQHMKNPGH